MSRQKLRHPSTLAHAVMTIIERVGAEVCAAAVGRSPRLLYDWADPDHDTKPGFDQAEILDALWLGRERGKSPAEAPIAACYLQRLERRAFEINLSPSPVGRVIELTQDLGELAEAVAVSSADGLLTPNEKARIAKEAADVRDRATRLIAEVT